MYYQVQETITKNDIDNFKSLIGTKLFDDKEKFLSECKLYFFKFGITDLKLNKEKTLFKNISTPLEEFVKTIENQKSYFKELHRICTY